MVAAIDRSNVLTLSREDFNRAMGWLIQAESEMHEVFKAGIPGSDGKAMDEIHHFIINGSGPQGMAEHKIVKFARERVPAHSVMRVLEIMERAQMIRPAFRDNRTGARWFQALLPEA